jgi:hypothetical protein
MNMKLAYNSTINFTNAVELRNTEKYLHKIRCNWENTINNISGRWKGGRRIIVIRIDIVQ